MPQNFVEKTFVDGSQTSKFTKVFSLESFPLYGIDHLPFTLCVCVSYYYVLGDMVSFFVQVVNTYI